MITRKLLTSDIYMKGSCARDPPCLERLIVIEYKFIFDRMYNSLDEMQLSDGHGVMKIPNLST
ncbi:MAG: hypothetical protein HY015_10060 [Bacteroidetes bacterium]|nr:hypothetical protein [Bacteroidota bacterium]MBI3483294.1 hypothetical protein [Bacteroidota bacterium]